MAPMIFWDGIINPNFINRLKKDMKKYDILCLCVPLGWEKEAILKAACENTDIKDVCWLEDTKQSSLEEQISKIPKTKKMIYMIPNMEVIVEKGQQNLIWDLMENKKKGDVFVVATSAMIPAAMLPYTIMNRYISYGIEEVKPTNDDVDAYLKRRGISLSDNELVNIEKDCNNLPVYIYLLANLMSGDKKRYTRSMRERCFEDLFTYIDVVFFRSFSEEDQNALLNLSCLEEFDNQLISYMLNISRKEANDFVERILTKGSVFEKSGNGWKFLPVMKRFLERAIQKYFDFEERVEDYRKAMNYLVNKEKWLLAMRFAFILQDKEALAKCMDHYLKENEDYNEFALLEEYFSELPVDVLMKYPNLMIQGSILKATIGDRTASRKHEKRYIQLMESIEDDRVRKGMQLQLLFMYMSRPGMMKDDVLEVCTEILSSIGNADDFEEQQKFQPHFVSVLRGKKDYCRYFNQNTSQKEVIQRLHEIADKLNDHTYSLMLKFMEAEVHYERNELDQALDELVIISREAKISADERMQQLCSIAMVDLLAVKNQMSTAEAFPMGTIELEERNDSLFRVNCQAHKIYYHLLKNEKEPILRWMNHIAPDEQERFLTIQYYQYLIKAKVYIWQGQYVRARMILQLLLDYAEQYKMEYLEAQVRILEAVIYYREGNCRWKEVLIPALTWAKELEFIRVFADEGAAVYELLSRIAAENKAWEKDEFLKKVITSSKAQMLQYPNYLKLNQNGDIGEFSNSERSVMSLLVLGEKNAEIAERLCVSENTVKYHLKNIYQKLQVKSRSQAIHKIREHNLI